MKPLISILLLGLAALAALTYPGIAQESSQTGSLKLNSLTRCMEGLFSPTQPESERTVAAEELFDSLRRGQCLRLRWAIIEGDLDLTALPINGVDDQGEDLITIQGPFVIRDSLVSGRFQAAKRPDGPRVRFGGPVVLSGSVLGDFEAGGALFAESVRFEGASFASVRMDKATFLKGAYLAKARFSKPVFFTGVTVRGALDLSNAHFASLARLFGLRAEGTVDLSGARFESTADLSGWRVPEFQAAGVHFAQAARFANGSWRGPTTLSRAVFVGSVDFSGTRFEGTVDFRGAQFKSGARFFNVSYSGPVRFVGARFTTGVTFIQARFGEEANFSGAYFGGEATFNQAVFSGVADFSKVTFLNKARFLAAQFHGGSRFIGAQFQELDLGGAAFLSPAGPDWRAAAFHGDVVLDETISVAPWRVSREQLQDRIDPGSRPYLPWEDSSPGVPARMLLLGALALAGIALLILLRPPA